MGGGDDDIGFFFREHKNIFLCIKSKDNGDFSDSDSDSDWTELSFYFIF